MTLPVVLTIAGSDNSAGAGAQADLKTFSALGCYGVTAITCVVAEVPGKVSAIHPIPPGIVAEQVRLLFGAFPVAAMKTGMLYSREIIAAALARGLALRDAVQEAKKFVHHAISGFLRWEQDGKATDALNHFSS